MKRQRRCALLDPWTLGIGALSLYAFASGGFFLYTAITSSRGVVTTRPYEQSLQYETELQTHRATEASGIRIEPVLGDTELLFKIHSKGRTTATSNPLRYQALYLPDSSYDQSGELRKRNDGTYEAAPPLNQHGMWLIEIEETSTTPQLYWKKQVLFR